MPAEYVSKSSAILTKLATMLRIVPALQLVFEKFAALLRSKESGDRVISESVDRTRSVTSHTADEPTAILKLVPSGIRLEFDVARSPGNMKVSFQAARSIG